VTICNNDIKLNSLVVL